MAFTSGFIIMLTMKNIFTLPTLFLTALLMLSACSDHESGGGDAAGAKSIVVYYENDVHCAIEGYDKLASLRALTADTALVGVVSAGDFLQGGRAGALSRGGYIYNILKTIKYDAMTLGNHEFDFGIARLLELFPSRTDGADATLPMTCLNFTQGAEKSRIYPAYMMRTYGNKRVAFVGVTTSDPEFSYQYVFGTDESKAKQYTLNNDVIYTMVQQTVDDARRAGADYVVVLSHLGELTSSHVNSHSMIATTRGIDAVVDGHSHSEIPCEYVKDLDGREVPISQTGAQFRKIGKLLIDKSGHLSLGLIDATDVPTVHTVTSDSIASVQAQMKTVTEQFIAHTDFDLVAQDGSFWIIRTQETNIADIVTDAIRDYTGAEIAVVNAGAIRTGLQAGDINYGSIIDMFPYEEPLQTLKVPGEALLELATKCSSKLPENSGSFMQVSGMRFTVNTLEGNAVSQVEVYDREAQQYLPLDLDRIYTVAAATYCVTGGGLYGVLSRYPVIKIFETLSPRVVGNYIKKVYDEGRIGDYATVDNRITIIK